MTNDPNHTPITPWRRGPTPAGLSIYGDIHPAARHDNGRIFIARILNRPTNPEIITPETAANIIATGPEMLAILEVIIQQGLLDPRESIQRAIRDKAIAAINRARGNP